MLLPAAVRIRVAEPIAAVLPVGSRTPPGFDQGGDPQPEVLSLIHMLFSGPIARPSTTEAPPRAAEALTTRSVPGIAPAPWGSDQSPRSSKSRARNPAHSEVRDDSPRCRVM